MGQVIVIRNNNIRSKIYKNAEHSYQNDEETFYYSNKGSLNEEALLDIKENFKEGLVLLVSYKQSKSKTIEDIFIGSDVKITEQNKIWYKMKVHLTKEQNSRAIQSIIDKMDLDINADFEKGYYVLLSEMDSLFCELSERIKAEQQKKKSTTENIMNKEDMDITKDEIYRLSKFAQKDYQSVRIYPSSGIIKQRTEFQRDRERVVNCKAFRRLVDKAQIFSAEKGDYYRTRMTHSLEVNQIAKAISYALGLNLDLTEAIALGHDLGHTPFGHQGERTLDEILNGSIDVGIKATKAMFEKRCFGGFKHNYQSARILTQLEEKYKDFSGLNVSVQVIEGVLKHTRLKSTIALDDFLTTDYLEKININEEEEQQICSSLEGQVVAVADEIAQRGHDVDDALTSGVMTIEEFQDRLKIKKCKKLAEKIEREITEIDKCDRLIIDAKELKIARIVSSIVNYFIEETISHSEKELRKCQGITEITLENDNPFIEFSEEVKKVNNYLENVVQKKVICNNEVARADYNANVIVSKLFEKYYHNPRLLHSGTIHKIFIETLKHENKAVSNSAINLNDGSIKLVNEEIKEITNDDIDESIILCYLDSQNSEFDKNIVIFEKRKILIRAIVDYIAGMTDGYAMEEYEKLK